MGLIVMMRIRMYSLRFTPSAVHRLYSDLQKVLGTKDIEAYLTGSKVRA